MTATIDDDDDDDNDGDDCENDQEGGEEEDVDDDDDEGDDEIEEDVMDDPSTAAKQQPKRRRLLDITSCGNSRATTDHRLTMLDLLARQNRLNRRVNELATTTISEPHDFLDETRPLTNLERTLLSRLYLTLDLREQHSLLGEVTLSQRRKVVPNVNQQTKADESSFSCELDVDRLLRNVALVLLRN